MLDYTIKTQEGRLSHVRQVLSKSQDQDPQALTRMADYLLFSSDGTQTKRERKSTHPIITKNRDVTVSKRQVSFEDLISHLENGEDGLYALITNDKDQIMDHRSPITDDDLDSIPTLREHLRLIESLKAQFDKAEGRRKYSLKRQIIETWQQIYILKSSFRNVPSRNAKMSQHIKSMAHMDLNETISLDEDGMPQSDGMLSLFNYHHVSFLLTYYSQLKQESYEDLQGDMRWLLLDLENLVDSALSDHPLLYDLLIWKVDGYSNDEIARMMDSKYGITHSNQYFSSLWRNKVPKLIADEAKRHYLRWLWSNDQSSQWKVCGKCGQSKPAHPLFFSRNASSDGFYSVCNDCRTRH